MEWKDFATVFAVIVSSVALWVSWASYRLAQARDRREVEKDQPAIDLITPDCTGIGPWPIQYTVRNRGAEPIVVVNVRMPISIGRTPIRTRHPVRFADTSGVKHQRHIPRRDEGGDYEIFAVNKDLEPGETYEGSFKIIPEPREPFAEAVAVRFYVDCYVRDRSGTTYFLSIDRTIKPRTIAAAL